MPNNSSTGGFILPTTTTENDKILLRTFHDLFVGISGLDNTLVRPRFQRNPPPIPTSEVDWIAFGIQELEEDFTPFKKVNNDGLTSDYVYTDKIVLLLSFFGDNSEKYFGRVYQGLQVEQNRTALRIKNITFQNAEKMFSRYENINDQFYKRTDALFNFNRKRVDNFAEMSLLSLQDNIITN